MHLGVNCSKQQPVLQQACRLSCASWPAWSECLLAKAKLCYKHKLFDYESVLVRASKDSSATASIHSLSVESLSGCFCFHTLRVITHLGSHNEAIWTVVQASAIRYPLQWPFVQIHNIARHVYDVSWTLALLFCTCTMCMHAWCFYDLSVFGTNADKVWSLQLKCVSTCCRKLASMCCCNNKALYEFILQVVVGSRIHIMIMSSYS